MLFISALFVLKIFKFLTRHFDYVCRKKWFDEKDEVISNFVTSQPVQQTITVHNLPNIS